MPLKTILFPNVRALSMTQVTLSPEQAAWLTSIGASPTKGFFATFVLPPESSAVVASNLIHEIQGQLQKADITCVVEQTVVSHVENEKETSQQCVMISFVVPPAPETAYRKGGDS